MNSDHGSRSFGITLLGNRPWYPMLWIVNTVPVSAKVASCEYKLRNNTGIKDVCQS